MKSVFNYRINMNIISKVGYSTYTKEEGAYHYILMGCNHIETIRYIKSRKPVSPNRFHLHEKIPFHGIQNV